MSSPYTLEVHGLGASSTKTEFLFLGLGFNSPTPGPPSTQTSSTSLGGGMDNGYISRGRPGGLIIRTGPSFGKRHGSF